MTDRTSAGRGPGATHKTRAWAIGLALACAACGDNLHGAVVLMDVGEAAPAYGRVPFPTDADRDGAHLAEIPGFDRVVGAHADLIAAHLAALDGFGLRPAVEFFIEGPIDAATVPATTSRITDPLVMVNIEPGSPGYGVPIAMDWRYEPGRHVIAGSPHPGVELVEGTRYAAVVTDRVRATNGVLYAAPGLAQIAHDPPARWRSTADAYHRLDAMPALAGHIRGIAVFTIEHATDVLVRARDELANPAIVPPPAVGFFDPALIFDTPAKLDALLGQATRDTTGPRAGLEQWGTDNPTGIAHDHVAVVATGTMTIARFKGPDTGTNGPDDQTFQLGPGGVPIVQAIDDIPITFVLPKTDVAHPMPPDGFPVVIFGHGLGASRAAMMNLAEPLTSQGYAVVAIDMWGHGSRYDPTDKVNNFAAGKPAFTGDPNLRDGFGDNTGYAAYLAFFDNFLDVAAVRDSIRQSALDFSRVATLIQERPDLSALARPYGAAPKLDPAHVAYLGESFGTIVGTDLAAIEPNINLYVLDVPGGGLLDEIMPNSPEIGTLAIPLIQQIYRTRGTLDRFHPVIAAMQAVLDAGDPLAFAPHVLADRFAIANHRLGARSVVCIQAVTDEIMPRQSTAALARAFGLAVLKPDLDPPSGLPELPSPVSGNIVGETAVLVQYEPATHGYNWSALHGQLAYRPGYPYPGDDPFPKLPAPITITEPIYATQAQVAEILATYFAGRPPVVVSTQPPVADFDGDGVPDDQDAAPWDPTMH